VKLLLLPSIEIPQELFEEPFHCLLVREQVLKPAFAEASVAGQPERKDELADEEKKTIEAIIAMDLDPPEYATGNPDSIDTFQMAVYIPQLLLQSWLNSFRLDKASYGGAKNLVLQDVYA
jgi:hypothetical protein